MNTLKNKYVIAALVSGAVLLIWYGLRRYNTEIMIEELGLSGADIDQYQGTDKWLDAENWDGYEAGDPIPEAVK